MGRDIDGGRGCCSALLITSLLKVMCREPEAPDSSSMPMVWTSASFSRSLIMPSGSIPHFRPAWAQTEGPSRVTALLPALTFCCTLGQASTTLTPLRHFLLGYSLWLRSRTLFSHSLRALSFYLSPA